MRRVIRAAVVFALLACQAHAGEEKVRGRIQDYEKAKAALVVYPRNHDAKAKKAIREAGFRVQDHLGAERAYRVKWSGDRKKLQEMLKALADSQDVQLISPDSVR